eukprot:CAMPEP_0184349736 /NCGR_PEP_ID=MMETSP1089-20130417/36648_1 /TAXON_ID=38269 ORGANISM="Gloeochaete wittrockiana, Strain SAG46.84" /NCGR_SAMPLE_ID=MMETSP1089 /ASSEMBLY_ACC=CAM_ASM_000445 /LENGTH=154 /DNA_ID=CAMNT_0026682165 /DNA_START=18 /DNA_END=482 /DNA_ORIENTATION=+
MALVIEEGSFNHVLRIANTNVVGTMKIAYALTSVKGLGRRFSHQVCKAADIDTKKRAGELNPAEVARIVEVFSNPVQYGIPKWFLNRQKDIKDGSYSHLIANSLDQTFREDITRMKKIRLHRGVRHHYGLRVRGQHTKTTGRRGRTVGVASKKK